MKPHTIKEGDTVLLQQKKSKQNPPFDPQHYTVVNVQGHQIEASRDGRRKTRDAKMWKKVELKPKTNYNNIREFRRMLQADEDSDELILNSYHSPVDEPALVRDDISPATSIEDRDDDNQHTTTPPVPFPEQDHPPRRSARSRKPPKHLEGYVGQHSGHP